jgi:hypothetical protein
VRDAVTDTLARARAVRPDARITGVTIHPMVLRAKAFGDRAPLYVPHERAAKLGAPPPRLGRGPRVRGSPAALTYSDPPHPSGNSAQAASRLLKRVAPITPLTAACLPPIVHCAKPPGARPWNECDLWQWRFRKRYLDCSTGFPYGAERRR